MKKKEINNEPKQLEMNFEAINSIKRNNPLLIKNEDSVKVIPINRFGLQTGKAKEQELVNYILKHTKSF